MSLRVNVLGVCVQGVSIQSVSVQGVCYICVRGGAGVVLSPACLHHFLRGAASGLERKKHCMMQHHESRPFITKFSKGNLHTFPISSHLLVNVALANIWKLSNLCSAACSILSFFLKFECPKKSGRGSDPKDPPLLWS